jgi:hypothetical protein
VERLGRSELGPSLEIVHAQYHRAVALATRGEPADRAAAFAEAQRLVEVAVALRARVTANNVAEITARERERDEPARRDSRKPTPERPPR